MQLVLTRTPSVLVCVFAYLIFGTGRLNDPPIDNVRRWMADSPCKALSIYDGGTKLNYVIRTIRNAKSGG